MKTNNKLREAMLSIRADILKRRSENCWYATDSDILEKINSALAEPVRNCDVGDGSEQEDRFAKYCRGSNYCAVCPIRKSWDFKNGRRPSCAILWAQMPYKEGGAK